MLGPAGAGRGHALHADQPAGMDGALLGPPELTASQPGSGVLLRGRLLALESNGYFTGGSGGGGGHDFIQSLQASRSRPAFGQGRAAPHPGPLSAY